MQPNKKEISPYEWGVKISALIPWLISTPILFQKMVEGFSGLTLRNIFMQARFLEILPIIIPFLLFIGLSAYMIAIWVGFGREDGGSWIYGKAGQYGQLSVLIRYLLLVWVVTFVLLQLYINLVSTYDPVAGQRVILIAVFISFSMIGLRTCVLQNNFAPSNNLMPGSKLKTWALPLLVVLILGFYGGLVIQKGLFWQGMSGDQTISIYASQTIANGFAPYEKYIIMHPPMAYLPGAFAIIVGNFLGGDPIISVRMMSLLLVLGSGLLTFKIAQLINGNNWLAGLIAMSTAFTIGALVVPTSSSPTKLIVTFFVLLLILLIQLNRMRLAGGVLVFLIFSWAGAIIFLPVPFIISLMSKEIRKDFVLVLQGFIITCMLWLGYFLMTSSLDAFINQYMLGLISVITSKFQATDASLTTENTQSVIRIIRILRRFELLDLILIFIGLFTFINYFIEVLIGKFKKKQYFSVFRDKLQAPVILSGLALIVINLIDFQSFLDLIPLIPILAVSFSIGFVRFFNFNQNFSIIDIEIWKLQYVMAFIVGIYVIRFSSIVPKYPVTLKNQELASLWVDSILTDNDSVQVIGNLSYLIQSKSSNASSVIHLGPKTVSTMQSIGYSLSDFHDELLEVRPKYILLDNRNTEQVYLEEFYESLAETYSVIELHDARGHYARIYYLGSDKDALLLAAGLDSSAVNENLLLANLNYMNGDYVLANSYLLKLIGDDRKLTNFAYIKQADIYKIEDRLFEAFEALNTAANQKPFEVWGNLELGTFYLELEQAESSEIYFKRALGDNIPLAFDFLGPKLFMFSELYELEVIKNIKLADGRLILSHNEKLINSEDLLMTFWWWTTDYDSEIEKDIAIQWEDSNLQMVGNPNRLESTKFYPGVGVRWSYLVRLPAGELPHFFRIGTENSDGTFTYGDSIELRLSDD